MPHPKGRKQSTRFKVLHAAAILFRAKGYEATTIAEIMLACGLTPGGFYAHFRSKAHLYAEALADAHSCQSTTQSVRNAGKDWLSARLANCEWQFLARDVANASPEVRKAYADALRVVRDILSTSAQRGHHNALAATALFVGALAISETIDDAGLKESIAEACRSAVQSLGSDEPLSFFWMPERAEGMSARSPH